MKAIFFQGLLLMLSATPGFAGDTGSKRFLKESKHFSAYINDNQELVVIRKGDKKEILRDNLSDYDAGMLIEDTSNGEPYTIWDINFDGYDDISYRSNSGNVQRFENVYLYNPAKRTLELNETLSEIACLGSDPATKTITGSCFHSSAAENWSETYRWSGGRLILVEKEGTMPCPPDQDCYYTYKQKRVKGKMVYQYKTKNKI